MRLSQVWISEASLGHVSFNLHPVTSFPNSYFSNYFSTHLSLQKIIAAPAAIGCAADCGLLSALRRLRKIIVWPAENCCNVDSAVITFSYNRKYRKRGIAIWNNRFIFVSVFHRILDFKNGAGCLSWPLFFLFWACFTWGAFHTKFISRKERFTQSLFLAEICFSQSARRNRGRINGKHKN